MKKADRKLDQPGAHSRYLLASLSPADREVTLRMGEVKSYRNGDYLVRQNDPSDGLHIILSGLVESVYQEDESRELTLSYWSKGDSVGAPNVLSERPHIWSAKAIGAVEALSLKPAALRGLISSSPNFAMALVGCIAFKAERYARLAQMLAMHSVERRVAEVLLAHGDAHGAVESGDMTLGKLRQHDLAKMVGATRQAVSLALRKFEAQHLIEIRPTTIVVKQLGVLRRLSLT